MGIHNGFELFVKSRGNGCYSFHSIHDALLHDKTLQRKFKVPYSREQKHVSISDTPMLLIEINSISNMGCQK
jgi:hypothetical protein